MVDILGIAVAAPAQPFCLGGGELHGVGIGIAAVIALCPGDIAISKVIALQCQLDMLHVNGIFHLGGAEAGGQILDAHVNGILRVGDPVGAVGIAGVIAAL